MGLFVLLVAATLAADASAASGTQDLAVQRELFKRVLSSVERGDWRAVENLSADQQQQLQAYVLWPDLRAIWLRANIGNVPVRDVESFLSQYGSLRPALELRYRHALQLAGSGDLAGYYRVYERFYQGQDIPKLDCLALQAELAAGHADRVNGRAMSLWLVGKSQVDECDPVFAHLSASHLLDEFAYRTRYQLAIDSRQFSLARWLGKQIDQQQVDNATRWQSAAANPEDFLRQVQQRDDSSVLREQLVYAARKLTYRDPVIAGQRWSVTVRRFNFSDVQKIKVRQHIALWTARDKLPGADELLRNLPPAAQSDEVRRWRARISLRNGRWSNLLDDISQMSSEERAREEWLYWGAVAESRLDQPGSSNETLTVLSEERSYYGFLAADELGRDYALEKNQLIVDEHRVAALAARSDVKRSYELFAVGLDGRGRSEWDALTRQLSAADRLQAAILADRWAWHSRAITTVASLGEYDDLTLRYPLPFLDSFKRSANSASINVNWAYSIARSESLFMRDVRSSSGAIGLMQLMPATGRLVARSIQLPYSGLTTLTNPDANIRLGTTYLGQMFARYNGNEVLATAAYNAGPHRVDRWLPEAGSIDARIWVENIPFNETRKYVKRVMAAQTIFHWRMTGKIRRLSSEMINVEPRKETPRLAAANRM
jgi:soluble lytic murein transglycosylase